jgi:DNA segregation ATPase FtsK/SpoIIIE-like protein
MVMLAWRYMGEILGTLVIFLFWLLTVATGFGFWSKLETWLLRFAGEASPVVMANPTPDSVPIAVEKQSQPEKAAASKKKAPQIPPEFRTSFKATPKKEEKPAKPLPRGEDLPPLTILLADSAARADERTINQTAGLIMKTLADFGIPATVIGDSVCRPAWLHQKARLG